MTQHFTIDPNPPCKGKPVKICYTGPLPATGSAAFDGGAPKSLSFTAANPCVTITVPGNAVTMVLTDISGDGEALTTPVAECSDATETARAKPKSKPKKRHKRGPG